MIGERELSQALSAGLAGVSLYRWGWHALETDVQPPTLPLVTLMRLTSNVDGVSDMCDQAVDLVGDTTLETHAWHPGYEDVRELQDVVREIIVPTGWRLLGEQDAYDGLMRAWRVSAQWSNIGPLMVTAPPSPIPPPAPEDPEAVFVPLHLFAPAPEPPPVRAFAAGFDEGFA